MIEGLKKYDINDNKLISKNVVIVMEIALFFIALAMFFFPRLSIAILIVFSVIILMVYMESTLYILDGKNTQPVYNLLKYYPITAKEYISSKYAGIYTVAFGQLILTTLFIAMTLGLNMLTSDAGATFNYLLLIKGIMINVIAFSFEIGFFVLFSIYNKPNLFAGFAGFVASYFAFSGTLLPMKALIYFVIFLLVFMLISQPLAIRKYKRII